MSGAPRLRSRNVVDSEARPVLGPAGNKAGSLSSRKPASKPLKKVEKSPVEATVVVEKKPLPSSTVNSLSPKTHSVSAPSVLRRHEQFLHSNLSVNASCSSDASTASFHFRASTGSLTRSNSVGSNRKTYTLKPRSVVSDGLHQKKRCAWVTPNTDPVHVAFHDEEWGVPVHDDKKLFELLFLVHFLNLHDEFGSFDWYIWSFVNHKPIVSRFRYPRQVPVKTPKADVISKDLVGRGFRSVGPTVVYSFMQVAGITNDHLTSCFRFQECITAAEDKEENVIEDMPEEGKNQ
ncbi:26S proteasome non-ATPase regulatory subunit 9-like [Hibiscus syriacus]|uniref:26S proteasome non-ATPase regulatory subunit 9-like n=1 Tax=Hibiscus syriacus TaxID=106335 RepID=A0A6A3CZH9_HIBSY|nr:26S proteasome non-ATPase regulatory subunit 9-like [Hibiscus syriacus]